MAEPRQASNRHLPAAEKRLRIFDAARDVIMRRGYDAATMEEISSQARVGKGTLYNIFSSKEDLFFSLVMDGFERIREIVDAEVEPFDDPWERFEAGWGALMLEIFPQLNEQWAFTYQLWGLLARDAAARDRMFAAWRALYASREQQIVTAITDGQKTGRFGSSVTPSSIALLLLATLDGLLHRAMFDPERVVPDAVLLDLLRLVRPALAPTSGRETTRTVAGTGKSNAARNRIEAETKGVGAAGARAHRHHGTTETSASKRRPDGRGRRRKPPG